MIKRRKAKNSKRGLYLQDIEIQQTDFKVGSPFKYIIDNKNKKIVIVPSQEPSLNTVSKRTTKNGLKPVIDIRNRNALSVFKDADYLEVEILQDQIIVSGFEESKESFLSKASKKVSNLFTQQKKVIDISSFHNAKKRFEITLSKNELKSAVGCSQFEQLSIYDYLDDRSSYTQSSINTIQNALDNIEIPLQVISLFSGAGLMDCGFIEEGFDISFALEIDHDAVDTYRANHNHWIEKADIINFNKNRFAQIGSPIMIGGPSCKGFSQANRQTNYLDNPNNLLVKEFIKSIQANPNCQVFVLENVPQLLTAWDGKFKQEIYDELGDFEITSGVLTATDYGEAQERKRAFIIGSKIGQIELPKPTHTPDRYLTVREAFEGLNDSIANQLDYSKGKASTIERMKTVPQGGNYKDFPEHLKTMNMLLGKAHSSIYKRLEWDKPSITIANPRKLNLTHPMENRILSIRECARLFGVKDDYQFKGSLSAMQQQLCNGVPVKMAKAIANVVKNAIIKYNIRNKNATFQLV